MADIEKTELELLEELVAQTDDLSPKCVLSGLTCEGPSVFPSGLKLNIHNKYHRLATRWLAKNVTACELRMIILRRDAAVADGLGEIAVEFEDEIITLERQLFKELHTYLSEKKAEIAAKAKA